MTDLKGRPKRCIRCENEITLTMNYYTLTGIGTLCEPCVDSAYTEALNDTMGWGE